MIIITPAWLRATSHCADGLDFGLATVPPEGLDLDACWPLIHRPDWAIALAVKSLAVPYCIARPMVETVFLDKILSGPRDFGRRLCRPSFDALALIRSYPVSRPLADVRAEIAAEAYAATARGEDALGHRLNAVAMIAGADIAGETVTVAGYPPLALERLQGAAYSLGLAFGHAEISDSMKIRIAKYINASTENKP